MLLLGALFESRVLNIIVTLGVPSKAEFLRTAVATGNPF